MPWMRKVEKMSKKEKQDRQGPTLRVEESSSESEEESAPDSRRAAQQKVDAMLARLDQIRKTPASVYVREQAEKRTSSTALAVTPATAKRICAPGADDSSSGTAVTTNGETAATCAPPNAPVTLCGMQLVLNGDTPPPVARPHGSRPEKAIGLHHLRDMLTDIEKGTDPDIVARKQAAEKREQEARKNRTIKVNASYEAAQTYKSWLEEKDFWLEQNNLTNPPNNKDRENSKRAAAARLHNKQQRKQALQQTAEEARLKFGMNTLEKENKKKREELLSSTTFTQEQQRGLSMFLRRTPRNILINLIAAGAQVPLPPPPLSPMSLRALRTLRHARR